MLTLDLEIEDGKVRRVRVDMGAADPRAADIPTLLAGNPPSTPRSELDGRILAVTAVSMGNPHAVIYVDDVQTFLWRSLGPSLEHHPAFPGG